MSDRQIEHRFIRERRAVLRRSLDEGSDRNAITKVFAHLKLEESEAEVEFPPPRWVVWPIRLHGDYRVAKIAASLLDAVVCRRQAGVARRDGSPVDLVRGKGGARRFPIVGQQPAAPQ